MSARIELTILGEPASKANSRMLVTLPRFSPKLGRKIPMAASIKSEKAREYEKTALLQIPPAAKVMLACPVRVTIRIFYASERPDLDESVVLDVLQAKFAKGTHELERAGVYVNDRQVREKHVFHAIDARNPRAEIVVEPIAPTLFDELPEVRVAPARKRSKAAQLPMPVAALEPDGKPF